jgi:hypothetical protein
VFAPGSRKLVAPGRPVDRATLVHHLAVLPLHARTLALVTGSAPGELPDDAILVRWVAARLRALSARLVAGETSISVFRREASGLASLGSGLAPAGEEMLVGLAAAARRLATWRLVPVPATAAFQASLVGLSGSDAPPATSRALDDAVRGGFPAHVASLVDLLGNPDAEDGALRDATHRLTGGGTRPGADLLAGIVAIVRDVALGPF